MAAAGLTSECFLQPLQGMSDCRYGRAQGDGSFTYRMLLAAGMHFMNAYNYNIEPLKCRRSKGRGLKAKIPQSGSCLTRKGRKSGEVE